MNISSLFSPLFHSKCDSLAPAPPPLPPIGGGASKSGTTATPETQDATSTSAPPPPPPLSNSSSSSTPAAPPPPASAADDEIARVAASVSACPNPGPLEMATYDVRRLVSLDTYDGARVDISKQLSPFFATVHSFQLGSTMLPEGKNASYNFTTQFNEDFGFAMARVDPERGTVDGRIHALTPVGMAKIQLGATSEGQNDQLLGELDCGAETWTANLKYGSMGGGNVFGCNYYQAVTPRLAMGGEGMYIGANGNMLSSYTAKYLFPNVNDTNDIEKDVAATGGPQPGESPCFLAATYNAGQGALSVNYKRAVTPSRVTLVSSLEASLATLESQVLVGAEFSLTRSRLNFCVDGSGRVQGTLEARLGREHGSPSLNFAAELDHGKGVMKFGYGMNIGS